MKRKIRPICFKRGIKGEMGDYLVEISPMKDTIMVTKDTLKVCFIWLFAFFFTIRVWGIFIIRIETIEKFMIILLWKSCNIENYSSKSKKKKWKSKHKLKNQYKDCSDRFGNATVVLGNTSGAVRRLFRNI